MEKISIMKNSNSNHLVNLHIPKEENSTKGLSRNNSLNSNSYFDELNTEIKTCIENKEDNSFSSSSSSKSKEQINDIDYLLDPKYWKTEPIQPKETEEEDNFPRKKSFMDIEIYDKKKMAFSTADKSNKQNTTSNEDDEIKVDKMQIMTDNDSPLDKSVENLFKSSKSNQLMEEKEIKNEVKFFSNENLIKKFDAKINSNDIINTGIIKNNNCQEFIFPYNPSYNNNSSLFKSTFLPQPQILFNQNFDIFSSINKNSGIISIQNNKIETSKNDNEYNIKDQLSNKFNLNSNISIKKNDQISKNIINFPLINQNLSQDLTININNLPKINQNFHFLQKIPNLNVNNKPDIKQWNNNSFPEMDKIINKKDNINNFETEKKTKSEKNLSKNINKGEKQVLNLNDIASGKDRRTTVMIRNIPIKYNEDMLNEALEEFNKKYDCLYMPYDYDKNGNKGYAFINFVNPLHILLFYEKFNGKKWKHFESSKICELNCAHFQGLNELQKHSKNCNDKKKNIYKENENVVVPSKYLFILKNRFPRMTYTENKIKKLINIKTFN